MCLVSQFCELEPVVCMSVHAAGRHAPIQGPRYLLSQHSNAKVSLGVTVQYIIHTKTQQQTGNIKILF